MRKTMNPWLSGILVLGIMLMLSCKRENPNELSSELLPLEGNPLVHLKILVKVGSANDPAGKEGLAYLTFNLLANGGTKTRTFKEITDAFYPLAAAVSVRVDKEMTAFAGTIHRDNLEKYYAIFKEMVLEPGFREDDFTRLKTNQLNFLEKTLINNMDEQFGKEILSLMLYEGHPYEHLAAGTVETVTGIILDDVKAFYKEQMAQGNVTIGLAGGFPADFPSRVAADFAALPKGFTPKLSLPPPRSPQGIRVVIAEKQTPATAISVGFPVALNRSSDDFFALWIAGSHFGEHRQHVSLLFQKIREERGQNYGDYAYIEHFIQGRDKFPATNYCRQQQYFSIWIRPLANSNRHFVLRQALRELRRLVEEGTSEERFELVRTYLLNYTKLYAQTLDERLGWQIDSRYYGYKDFLAEVQLRLPKLTSEDVNRAIKKYLNFENLHLAIITQDGESLKKALVENTPSPIAYANPNMPKEVLEEDQVIQAYPLEVESENVKVRPAFE
ncbi:MAG: pitrilysin family protein, partial [Acidobacteriota bacterium]